ncbi:hypothetical protein C8J57DRAFT_1231597 [Mycena rebaudengoi]|nr:hypothetical protein C8J57DRAFT_1231597 [Mycena rebaudengoi]
MHRCTDLPSLNYTIHNVLKPSVRSSQLCMFAACTWAQGISSTKSWYGRPASDHKNAHRNLALIEVRYEEFKKSWHRRPASNNMRVNSYLYEAGGGSNPPRDTCHWGSSGLADEDYFLFRSYPDSKYTIHQVLA